MSGLIRVGQTRGAVFDEWLYKRVATLEEDELVVFYYLTASEIWPDERGCL